MEGNWNCAKRDAQRVPRQLGVAMGARAADPRCAADPHLLSPASAAAFLRATSRRRVAAEQLVVRCAGPADAKHLNTSSPTLHFSKRFTFKRALAKHTQTRTLPVAVCHPRGLWSR